VDMELFSAWEAERAEGTYIGFHAHEYHELVYYPYGGGVTVLGEEVCAFSENCFAVIPPSVAHDEKHLRAGAVLCLVFSCDAELEKGVKKDTYGAVYRVAKELLAETQMQKRGYADMIRAKLAELCVLIARAEDDRRGEKDFGYVINHLKENYHEHIRLSDCAKQLNISYDYFQHRFKAVMGMSPQRFLLSCRLRAAERMLLDGRLGCTEIAFRCGFSTSAQFSAIFKRENGVSPLEYRKAFL